MQAFFDSVWVSYTAHYYYINTKGVCFFWAILTGTFLKFVFLLLQKKWIEHVEVDHVECNKTSSIAESIRELVVVSYTSVVPVKEVALLCWHEIALPQWFDQIYCSGECKN